MKRALRPALFVLVAVMSLALVGDPLVGNALAARPAAPQQDGDDDPYVREANWRLGARWAPYKMEELVHDTRVDPRWIEGSQKFWYDWETSEGKRFWIVDPEAGTRAELWDNDRIAAELTRITRDPWDGQHLPVENIRFIDENTLQFDVTSSQDEEVEEEEEETEEEEEQEQEEEEEERPERPDKKVFHFEYDVQTQTLRELEDYEEPDDHPRWASVSPDGNWVVFVRDHDLHMMSGEDYERILDARRGLDDEEEIEEAEEAVEVEEIRLTEDGEEHYSYQAGFYNRGDTDKEVEENQDDRKAASITWSKDSRRFALVRDDRREVGDLWVIHVTGNDRPELETYRYDMPGEENVTQNELYVYDLESRDMVQVQADAWKDQSLNIFDERQFFYPDSTEPRQSRWLSDDADNLYFMRTSRDRHRIDVCVADATTGEVTVLVEERMNTYQESQRLELLPNGEMVWWSERDGWAHLYRFAPDGTLMNRLTEGPWSVRRVVDVDEENGVVFFVANGREEGEDPYYQHLYRVNLDGSGLRLLNPGDFDHSVSMNEAARYFIDNYSRVNTTPASALFDRDGEMLMDLEEADFSRLTEAGYVFPEPYRVKAADGVTDNYGVMYKPFDFDPEKRYPIVAYVYPGPQTEAVSKSFRTNASEVALAQLGFIVVTIGNRGGHPARSKWYHNYGYGNLRDYGLADKKAGIEQLGDRHPFIDIDRVGIYGHSGGGFMSTAAMLIYPDFFDVAVSSSGNHENQVYNRWWSETHHGVEEVVDDEGNVTFEYEIDKNSEVADNLKGKLLLTTGTIDNNVHHANTFRLAEALINANKRFDMFIFPGQRHGYRGHMGDYWFWLRAEYFAEHLLGDERTDVDIAELNMEREADERNGGTRRRE